MLQEISESVMEGQDCREKVEISRLDKLEEAETSRTHVQDKKRTTSDNSDAGNG